MSNLPLSKGRKERPDFIVIYGVPGVGKSTFASGAPSPLFIDIEDGSAEIDTTRIEADHLRDFHSVASLMKEAMGSDFKTIVIDSLSKLEKLIWDATCKRKPVKGKVHKSIEDFGFKQGYIFCLDEWQEFIDICEELRNAGKNVILIAHNVVKNFNDPTLTEPYARYELELHAKASSLIKKQIDAVLFANYKTLVNNGKGLETGQRVIHTERRPGHDGKNRFGLPYEVDLSYPAYCEAKKSSMVTPDVLKRQIEGLLIEISDEATSSKIKEAISKDLDVATLKNYLHRVEIIIGQKEGE